MDHRRLSWGEKLALIDFFKPSLTQACECFGVSEKEILTAEQLRNEGLVKIRSVDFDDFKGIFDTKGDPNVPRFSHQRKRTLKKRGRKSNNTDNAYKQLPSSPTVLSEYCSKYNISQYVMKQSSRFDRYSHLGTVRIKKMKDNNGNKITYIWRQTNDD